MSRDAINDQLLKSVDGLLKSIRDLPAIARLDRGVVPSRDNAAESIDRLMQLVFPGYFGRQGLTHEGLPFRVGEVVMELADQLYDQIRFCLRYRVAEPEAEAVTEVVTRNGNGNGEADLDGKTYERECVRCDHAAAQITLAFFDRLPAVRDLVAEDVQTAFDSDPAATSTDETIFCYPGLFTIAVQRLAHELHKLGVPLLPRIWTEVAHGRTGIEIHPGAQLGRRFFIDHGTGVVIGETTVIGQNVKLYQGVTLGALAPHYGQSLRGTKRHPTIEDDVIIYAGATVLGGDTVIGKGTVIGGNVFITSSVPANSIVMMEEPKLRIRDRTKKRSKKNAAEDVFFDFQI